MNKFFPHFIIIAAGSVLFFFFLGKVHLFDWDEINFAECSREMINTNDYTRVYIDYMPFWEKPPMFFWMQSASMRLFGVTEFAARFPNALCGIITLLVVFLCGKKIYDKKFGVYWALAFAGSLFPNLYFKSGIIDPWFNLFTFLSLYLFILYTWKRNGFGKEGLKLKLTGYAIGSGLFMGLAILMKGQVALMLFMLVLGVYFIYNRFKIFFDWGHALLFFITCLFVTFSWFGYETIKNGPWFITEFLKYQYRLFTTHDAGQAGFFGYHFVVILIGCFPASVFAIPAFFKTQSSSKYDKDFKIWMLILFWVVLILFTVVQSRIIHYSALAWFPVTFLAAYTFYKWESKELVYKKFAGIFATVIGCFIALLLTAVPFFAMNIQKVIPYVKDKFAQANMQAIVNWTGFECVIGLLMFGIVIGGLIHLKKANYEKAAWIYFTGNAIVVFLASATLVPKIERYSQGAAIDFFKERKQEDCYVEVLGYKSYAQLFYTQKKIPANQNSYDKNWLLTGNIDKPAYFVTKVDKIAQFEQYKELKELYRKNGFIFLKREIPDK